MIDYPLLSVIILMPFIGALTILFATNDNDKMHHPIAFGIAFITSLITFGISVLMWVLFDPDVASFQFVENRAWFENFHINYAVGVDGLSIFFVLLTTIITPICILSSKSVETRFREYMMLFLVLESIVLGVFLALDFLLFYVFFEAMLIPMFLIIGIWGGDNRIYASYKFFLYTLAGSVFLLLAMIYFYSQTETMSIAEITRIAPSFSPEVQIYLFLAMFISFAVKVPMWPVHTWLPDAHVEAPTAASVILAAILLKMGGYGFLRFSIPMLPDASIFFAPYIFVLSSIAVIYASLVAFAQENMKKLIAYSSIAHMGFVTIGIFTFTLQGIEGAIMQMISHGLVSAALFLCVGVLYERMHTKDIAKYGGVAKLMPKFALIFMFFTMASIGLPGTSGFVGEFLVLVGTYSVSKIFTALALTGVVLGAAYMLVLYKNVMFGEVLNNEVNHLKDVSVREIIYFIPLVILTIYLGLYPSLVTDVIKLPVENILIIMKR